MTLCKLVALKFVNVNITCLTPFLTSAHLNVGPTYLILRPWFTPWRHQLASDPLPWPEDLAAWRTFFTVSGHDLQSQSKRISGRHLRQAEDRRFEHSLCILWSFSLECIPYPIAPSAWRIVIHSSWWSSSAFPGNFSDFYSNKISSIVLPVYLITPTHCTAIAY